MPSKKRLFVGLRLKFGVLFVVLTVFLSAFNVVWNYNVQSKQAQERMVETAQVLARQCDSVWEFMEINQQKFVKKPDGTYDMYCVVAAKSVTRLFSSDGSYNIHYTNTTTRKDYDAPDDFEFQTITEMRKDNSPQSYYVLTENSQGQAVFRYMEPIYITESCLECHGSPKGELDMMGYPKEGMKEGDVAGALSITMPAQDYLDDVLFCTIRESAMFLVTSVVGLLVVYYGLSKLVTRPMRRLETASQKVAKRDFSINLDGVGDRDEMESLAQSFQRMADDLSVLYTDLEVRVEERTQQLIKVNEELEQANQRLAQEGQYKDDFLATMSHEIRTPLTSILAFTDIFMKETVAKTPEEEQMLEALRYNSRLLLEMVNNVLNMARAGAGRTELSLEPFSPVEFVSHMRENMDFIARRKNVNLAFQVQRGIPVLMADADKLTHILENLLTNAIKFSHEGGEVRVDIAYNQDSKTLVLSVADQGCGIAPEDLDVIFDRYTKASMNLSVQGVGGSGLGLAVVEEFAQEHGGSVRVESELGKGSTFFVEVHAEMLAAD